MAEAEPLNLVLPQNFETVDAEELRQALCRHLDVSKPRYILRKAADPSIGYQFIELIGDVARWLPLTAPAAVFLSTLAKRAADALWDAAAETLKTRPAKPLDDIAKALAIAMDRAGPDVDLIVGLDIPDPHWGTALTITEHDPVRIAHALALFATHAEQIAALMKAEVADGRAPLGRAVVSIENEALVIRWRTQKDSADCEVRIATTGP